MLKVWNMVLVALAFNLSIFGTFLTRSGVINSIHLVLAKPARQLVPRLYRHPASSSRSGSSICACRCCARRRKLESLVSREATFLYNNLLLVALCLTILWGVVYPLLTEAFAVRRARSRSRITTSSCTASGCRCCC